MRTPSAFNFGFRATLILANQSITLPFNTRFLSLSLSIIAPFRKLSGHISGTYPHIFALHPLAPLNRHTQGYLTEESGVYSSTITSSVSRSGRPLGPLASAKAKGRRSRSAQNANTTASSASGAITGRLTGRNTHTAAPTNANASTLQRSNSVRQSGHQSRSKFRTPGPAGGRLQTMSAERQMMMAPVTPKMQPDRPLSMLRYQKMGETVISLSGSPVIAQG